jgi:transcriptional regulator with XRE-family HTH domain
MPSAASKATVRALLVRMVDARKRAGLSQERLAELSGVNLAVISRAENLKRIPGLASLLDMASALNLDASALLADAMRETAEDSSSGTGGEDSA